MRLVLLLLPLFAFVQSAAAQACIDSTLIDPMGFCPMIWDPVCGCNGVTYGNSCEAEISGGVTSFTYGECTGTSMDCFDLGGVDFGDCEMAMGIGIVDGSCAGLSGCGWVVNGVDYSTYSFESMTDCLSACGGGSCQDLAGVDFGTCTMALGVALIEGSCVGLSGCGWVVDGVDYSVYSFESLEACETACGGACMDLEGIDFGLCDMIMGPAFIGGSCVELSGCGWIVNGVDYSSYSFASLEDCEAACGSSECIDPSLADPLVDCNPFDAEPVCGCDSITHVNPCMATYVDWVSTFEPGPCAGDCYDSERVMPEMACDEEENWVCGCDGLTYTNPCQAWYYGGLADWTEGPCATQVSEQSGGPDWHVQRLASDQIQLHNWPTDATWRAFSASGQLLAEGRTSRIDASGWRGLIVIAGPTGSQRVLLP